MKCERCGYVWKLPGQQAGGRRRVRKGFAVAPQPTPEARKRGWKKRKASSRAIGKRPEKIDA